MTLFDVRPVGDSSRAYYGKMDRWRSLRNNKESGFFPDPLLWRLIDLDCSLK
jgi:hypothetical protein